MNKIIISKPKKKTKIKGRGVFFSFLFMALVVIVLGAYTQNTHTESIINTPVSSVTKQEDKPIYEEIQKEVDKTNEENQIIEEIEAVFEDELKNSERLSLTPPSPTEKQIINSISLPVSGEIIKPFSDSNLVYSKTLADYRTHSGIDIKSKIGDNVLSPANGKISEISKDDKLGYTITIDHGNMISKISNLSSKIDLKVGDKVSQGEKIAYVGDSAEFEIADEPHIHFELIVNAINVNPLDYVEEK